jgi:hypothetical protein
MASPPQHAAPAADGAGDLVAMLGRDLATLVPGVRDCDLCLLAAHFDPAEALRPGWPLHQRVPRNCCSAHPGRRKARACWASARMPRARAACRCRRPRPAGGGLRVLPFVLPAMPRWQAGDALEELLLDAAWPRRTPRWRCRTASGRRSNTRATLSLHDLAAMMAMQYRNSGLDALWPLLETALLDPTAEDLAGRAAGTAARGTAMARCGSPCFDPGRLGTQCRGRNRLRAAGTRLRTFPGPPAAIRRGAGRAWRARAVRALHGWRATACADAACAAL